MGKLSVQFDNSNANDGVERIKLPKGVGGNGDGRFPFGKLFIFIVMALLIGGYLFWAIRNREEESFSKEKALSIMAEKFGGSQMAKVSGEKLSTGRDYAIALTKIMGEDRLLDMNDQTLPQDDGDYLKIAIDKGIISPDQVDKKITKDEAEEMAENALGLYVDPAYYPQNFELVLKKHVVNTYDWNISEFDEGKERLVAGIDGEIPEKGNAIIYYNEFGIAHAGIVSDISHGSNGEYVIDLEEIRDYGEIMETVSFSGAADFGYLTGKNVLESRVGEKTDKKRSNEALNAPACSPFYSMAGGIAAANGASEWLKAVGNKLYQGIKDTVTAIGEVIEGGMEWAQDGLAIKKEKREDAKCDIEFNIDISETETGGEVKDNVTAYVQIKSDNLTRTYKYDGKKLTASAETDVGRFHFKLSNAERKGLSEDSSYKKDKAGVKANLKITNFSLCASGYYQWADPNDEKNAAEIIVHADCVALEGKVYGAKEGKWKIGEFDVPIKGTAGTINVKAKFYIVASINGSISVWYEINDPSLTINASVERKNKGQKGLEVMSHFKDSNCGFWASVEADAGFVGELAISLFNDERCELANPGFDIRANAAVSTVKVGKDYKLKKEYENTKCMELNIQAPIAKVMLASGEDSALAKLLETLKEDVTWNITKKNGEGIQKPFVQLLYHVEMEKKGMSFIPIDSVKGHNAACTHIEPKNPTATDTGKAKKDLEKKASNAQNSLIQRLEEWLANWLLDSCNGCF